MLTGVEPFAAADLEGHLYRVLHDAPDGLDRLDPDVRALARALLSKEPAERPGHGLLEAHPCGLLQVLTLQRLGRFFRRSQRRIEDLPERDPGHAHAGGEVESLEASRGEGGVTQVHARFDSKSAAGRTEEVVASHFVRDRRSTLVGESGFLGDVDTHFDAIGDEGFDLRRRGAVGRTRCRHRGGGEDEAPQGQAGARAW